MANRWLVHVRTMSGCIFPQIWYDPPPKGYSGIDVVGEKLLIPQEVEADVPPDAVLSRVEALRRMRLAAA